MGTRCHSPHFFRFLFACAFFETISSQSPVFVTSVPTPTPRLPQPYKLKPQSDRSLQWTMNKTLTTMAKRDLPTLWSTWRTYSRRTPQSPMQRRWPQNADAVVWEISATRSLPSQSQFHLDRTPQEEGEEGEEGQPPHGAVVHTLPRVPTPQPPFALPRISRRRLQRSRLSCVRHRVRRHVSIVQRGFWSFLFLYKRLKYILSLTLPHSEYTLTLSLTLFPLYDLDIAPQ
jgi:hypothetical protein